jgi:luciferase-type oxidoreductase
VEQAGFAALWLRDVPFHDPGFGDAGQVYDPLVYTGWLASITTSIAIGAAGIVLPLRDPVFVAKQAASIDLLAGGRFLLGLSSGDRPAEYPAVGRSFDDRATRYRDAVELVRMLTGTAFPRYRTEHYGVLNGGLDLVPKPLSPLAMLAIGRAGQTIDWIADRMDG